MTNKFTIRLALLLGGLLLSFASIAAEGGALLQAGNDIGDRASLQRGAKLYVNYCSGCHSLKYMRYSRMAEDLGLTETEVMDNLNFTGAKYGEVMQVAMKDADGAAWFGKMPPDLSLVARAKPGGANWVYTYLKSFYLDESRPVGWNNTLFPNASMPNALWELQGLQHAEFGPVDSTGDRPVRGLKVTSSGRMTPAQFDQAVSDISNFLEYVGEPAALKRQGLGVLVLLFLAVFTFLTYLLKQEYWRDVH